jgi:hypothetical protein
MPEPSVKSEIIRIAENLPEDATWADLEYILEVRREVDEGRRSAREEPTFTVNEVRAEYGLDPLP